MPSEILEMNVKFLCICLALLKIRHNLPHSTRTLRRLLKIYALMQIKFSNVPLWDREHLCCKFLTWVPTFFIITFWALSHWLLHSLALAFTLVAAASIALWWSEKLSAKINCPTATIWVLNRSFYKACLISTLFIAIYWIEKNFSGIFDEQKKESLWVSTSAASKLQRFVFLLLSIILHKLPIPWRPETIFWS